MALGSGSTETLLLGKWYTIMIRKNSKPSCGKGFELEQPMNYIKNNGREWWFGNSRLQYWPIFADL